MSERTPVIEAAGLRIGYVLRNGKKKVVHSGLNLKLYAGEVTCLLGLNGAGKSTLLRTLGGFQQALSGEVLLQGKPLSAFSQAERSLAVGVVLTDRTHAGGITVYELVSLGRHPHTGFFGRLKKRDRDIITHSLQAAGISHKASGYVAELSDGERQKAMIAKALAQQCPIIILDEPTAFLDVTSRIGTMALLRRLAREQQKTILLSTHDIEAAIQMGDRLWLLEKERPLACGTPEDLILGGLFETFFHKDDIRFDPATGKLTATAPLTPIGLTGDPLTAHWAANALMRNGWRASSPDDTRIHVNCLGKRQIVITPPNRPPLCVNSIADLIATIETLNTKDDKRNHL
ncbi:MAG: ABC transporter ATP-binding protein [Tannerellaceae bacterium]|jgi:iron complex transport system ATP-binding protein|nr:ABC transporter ATP-binding protein [Tannerellaceae bacterium]